MDLYVYTDTIGFAPSSRAPMAIIDENLNVIWKNQKLLDFSQSLQHVFRIDTKFDFVNHAEFSRFQEQLKNCVHGELPGYIVVGDSDSNQIFFAYPFKGGLNGKRNNMILLRMVRNFAEPIIKPDYRYFAERWGFSERETRVGVHLLTEDSLSDIAKDLNLSYETVRWYLKRFCDRFEVAGRLGFVRFVYSDLLNLVISFNLYFCIVNFSSVRRFYFLSISCCEVNSLQRFLFLF